MLHSKVSLILPSWAPAWCYPQASQGLKVPLGVSATFGACGVGTETTVPTWLSTCGKCEGWRCWKYPWTHPKLWVASDAEVSLELALTCTDLKLEYVRSISQCLGMLEDMKTFGGVSEEDQRDLYWCDYWWNDMDLSQASLVHLLVLPLFSWDSHTTILLSLLIPCLTPSLIPHPKLIYLSPLLKFSFLL